MPRFSIIVVHYQGAIAHATFCRGIASLHAQTCKDYEILCYHDGPLAESTLPMPVPVVCMPRRLNDWGHSLRDRGIREAKGDYILHFNADNILYPEALEEIARAIERPARLVDAATQRTLDSNAIVVFGILMRGAQRAGEQWVDFPDRPDYAVLLSGNPPKRYQIDALQFVMKRQLWLNERGWHDHSHGADGAMYERFAEKYGYRAIEKVLGEHF